MHYRRNDQFEIESSKERSRKLRVFVRENLLQETLGSEALERLDPFGRVQLANVVEVVSMSRALLEAGSSAFRP